MQKEFVQYISSCGIYDCVVYMYFTYDAYLFLTEVTIGWERNVTTVDETTSTVELCLIIRDVDPFDILTGFMIEFVVNSMSGTAVGKLAHLKVDLV